jgi:predicted O-methyltransferase YrrM
MDAKAIFQEVNKIEGWFTEYECLALRPYVQSIRKDGLLVELGTYHGRSTLFYRLTNPDIRILTIDVCKQYNVAQTIPKQIDPSVLMVGNIFQVPGDSQEVVKLFRWPIDFLFIDTRHTYIDTLDTLMEWSRFVKPGGYIALHDYTTGFPGVGQAIEEFIKSNPKYSKIDLKLGIGLLKNNETSS